jgi:TorA-specific chaperone
MSINEKLDHYRRLMVCLAEIYWITPTKESIAALSPLILETTDLDYEQRAALEQIIINLDDAAVKEIAVDYTRLFCGFDPGAPFPYESIYRGEQRLLMQAPAAEVREIYRVNGYSPYQSASNEPADHIAYELGYIAFLLGQMTDALAQSESEKANELTAKLKAFLGEHAQLWIPKFCDDVIRQALSRFFKLLAPLTERGVLAVTKL